MKTNLIKKIDELKKELEKAENSNNFMYSQKLIQDIIKLYKNNNDKGINKAGIHKYKEKLKEINLKLPEQLKTFTQTLEIKNETIQNFTDFIINTQDLKDIYFNNDYLIELFQKKFLFSSVSSFEKFKIGIKKYCEGDFTSSIHILVPLFEEVFLYISNRLGIDIVALGRGKEVSTQTKTLGNEMLNNEIFNETFGKNFIQHIDFILFNDLGYKLRHKIAHGNIDFNECNFHNVSIILFLYFGLWSSIDINNHN